ncbi:MAG TPA: hypothetical protein VEG60_31355 [Candidatus Binatia bacterium]|nr:hypothetical protein [Candidatus Binatia bacterium]
MRHVERAFRIVESDGTGMVLLGMEPNEPDPEYGYILAGFGGKNRACFLGRKLGDTQSDSLMQDQLHFVFEP